MARPTLMFRLGRLVGTVARTVTGTTEPARTQRQVVRHDVHEEVSRQDGATVTLRRTTIEEIEVRADPPAPPAHVRAGRTGDAR